MTFSDTLDINPNYISNKHTSQYVFDARNTPWGIPEKKYDVVVALQVLEHFRPNQLKVFKEIKKIAKQAIITLPYKWDIKDIHDCHYMITDKKIAEFTDNEIPYSKEKVLGNHNRYRIELHYKF